MSASKLMFQCRSKKYSLCSKPVSGQAIMSVVKHVSGFEKICLLLRY